MSIDIEEDGPPVRRKVNVQRPEPVVGHKVGAPIEGDTESAPPRPELRQEMRPTREESPQDRAKRRAMELRDHNKGNDEHTDQFFFDPEEIPPGWSYEWKRKTVHNMEDPAYDVKMARAGWEPVPASRHPQYMPAGTTHTTIERDGMILMERPLEITREAQQLALKRARLQVRQKEAQLNAAPDGHFGRDNKGNSLVKIGKGYEPIPE